MKRCLLVLLLAGWTCAATVASAASSPSTLIANVPGRTAVSLSGSWRAFADPYEWGKAGYFRDAKPKDKRDLVEYSFDASPVMNVPGDWNTQRESLMFYEGPVWYRRLFSYHKRAGARAFVYFGAVNYQASVYLNGEKLGEHAGGFTALNFEATSLLREGENFLVVEVNNVRRADGVPALKFDWWNYGGITRDVMLIEEPETFIQDYWVQLSRGSQSEISGWVQLNGTQVRQAVTLEIPEAHVRELLKPDSGGLASFRFPAKLDLWSPEDPKLYDVILTSGSETIHDQIGFRTIEVQGAKILLNGKPIFLRGISMHEEAPFREGRAFSAEDAQTLLGWVKELGCNFVRFAHYPHNENEVRLADRMGLLVWSEIPVYWDIDWSNPATLANAEAQLRDMIARDHNRAAVILWSMSNETPVKPERLTFLKQLAQDARELDSTRLITSALNHTDNTGGLRTLSDPLGEVLDVLGINEYLGWYEGRPEDTDKLQWKLTWNKPLIVSEFGGGAPYGRHGDADERWTEEYQQNLYEHQLGMVEKMPNLAGLTPWVLMDFRSPLRTLPGVQDYHNRKGVVSNRGQRKLAFYTLQGFYKKMAEEKH
ncbi:MAG TPA: glycoside hydrolase family 2 TIM barrel-domain containing protein [Candidatus Dormibacteraeota bacterium]|nr:glycoside hydrolase family 2 TIM barrel-domain containing protein [Candidatus Dormibacteraeota bacterium]